ncbi:iron uptake porin [Geitlerinema sp. CS-897]|nr:iron uptake porin [Geitlerinema sp. CS-897]
MYHHSRPMLRVSPVLAVLLSANAVSAAIEPSETNTRSDKKLAEIATVSPSKQLSVDDFIEARENQSITQRRQAPSGNSRSQVTSVSQLSDVQPTDWAFQALQSLVERYGCIAGYPDGTYRGNSFMTRYEFAAGVNACLDQIVALIGGGDTIDPGDLATIRRLQEEFAAELAALRGRVDGLESRVAELEANQFSTTTQLQGEVVFGLADAWGGEEVGADNTQSVFQYRARLAFVSSFTGRDQLWTRLDAANAGPLVEIGGDAIQGATTYQTTDSGSSVGMGWLAYYFPIGDNVQVYLPAAFPLWQDFVPTVSPYFEGFTGASNAVSSWAESSPIYKMGLSNGGGVGVNIEITDELMLSGGYFGGDSFNPTEKNGLFNGDYSTLGQLTFTSGDFQVAATFHHGYFNNFRDEGDALFDTLVGTVRARNPFFDESTFTNSYGLQAAYQITDGIAVNAYGGFTHAQAAGQNAKAEIWYYGLGLAFPDLLLPGNLLGIMAGAEPYVGGYEGQDVGGIVSDTLSDDTAIHLETFYRFQLSDNISITPAVIWITAPDGDRDNEDVVYGVLRTTFTF